MNLRYIVCELERAEYNYMAPMKRTQSSKGTFHEYQK